MTTYNGWTNWETWTVNMFLTGNYAENRDGTSLNDKSLWERYNAKHPNREISYQEFLTPYLENNNYRIGGSLLYMYIQNEVDEWRPVYEQYRGGIEYNPNTQIVFDPVKAFAIWLQMYTSARLLNGSHLATHLPMELGRVDENLRDVEFSLANLTRSLSKVNWIEIAHKLLED